MSHVSPEPSAAEQQKVLSAPDFDRLSSDDNPSPHIDYWRSQSIRVVRNSLANTDIIITSDFDGHTATESPDADTESPDADTESPDADTESPDADTESPDADAGAPEENVNTAAEDPDPNPDVPQRPRKLRNGRFRHYLRRLREWLCG
jgi:FtsZ-interacting cell division protein ZipA